MKDERIQTTRNRFAAGGFFIWYLLMMISLNYRLLILKQPIRDFWDFLAIWVIGTLFVFIAYARNGVLIDEGFKVTSWRTWLGISIGAIIGILTTQFIMGEIHSVVDVGALLIGFLPGMGLVIAIVYFLNRRWKRKEGIEDEK